MMADKTVQRRFDIYPGNPNGRNADITFYFANSKISGNMCEDIIVYRWNKSFWQSLTTTSHSCVLEPFSVTATDVADFSKFILMYGEPLSFLISFPLVMQ